MKGAGRIPADFFTAVTDKKCRQDKGKKVSTWLLNFVDVLTSRLDWGGVGREGLDQCR